MSDNSRYNKFQHRSKIIPDQLSLLSKTEEEEERKNKRKKEIGNSSFFNKQS